MQHTTRVPGAAERVSGEGGWRLKRGEPSLREVWGSIPVQGVGWRRMFAFLGPGYLVSVADRFGERVAASLGEVTPRSEAEPRTQRLQQDRHDVDSRAMHSSV